MNYLAQTSKSAPALILLSIILIGFEFNVQTAFSSFFGRAFNASEPLTIAFVLIYTLVCLFFTPLTLSKYISRKNLKELGLGFPENKKMAWFLTIASALLLIPMVIFFAQNKAVQTFYTLKAVSLPQFLCILLFALPPYYFAEEFFFRGFLFMGLWRRLGWHSYWITELLFTWAHLGKPWIEILLSFPAGIVLNYLTLRTKSIYPAMLVHFMMGALLDTLVNYFV